MRTDAEHVAIGAARGRPRRVAMRAASAVLLVLLGIAPAAAQQFAARDNPFRYAREYRDPAWGGTYLRARWYHPQVPAFLGRDRAVYAVNRYGYGDGNPLMRVDPTGWHARDLQRTLARLDGGIGGHFARVFLSPILGAMQLAADPGAFWHALRHDSAAVDIFLVGGVAAELLTSEIGPGLGRFVQPVPFWARVGGELVLGSAQSAVASLSRDGRRFHTRTFVQGLEYSVGGEILPRLVGGLGYQPFTLRSRAAVELMERESRTLERGEAVLLRFRRPMTGRINWDTPLLETTNLGLYHEGLIAVTRDQLLTTEANSTTVIDRTYRIRGGVDSFRDTNTRFEYLGKVADFSQDVFFADPRFLAPFTASDKTLYNPITNNCHHHVVALRQLLQAR